MDKLYLYNFIDNSSNSSKTTDDEQENSDDSIPDMDKTLHDQCMIYYKIDFTIINFFKYKTCVCLYLYKKNLFITNIFILFVHTFVRYNFFLLYFSDDANQNVREKNHLDILHTDNIPVIIDEIGNNTIPVVINEIANNNIHLLDNPSKFYFYILIC